MLHFFSFISLCRSRALGGWLAAVLRRGRKQQTRLYAQGRAPSDSIQCASLTESRGCLREAAAGRCSPGRHGRSAPSARRGAAAGMLRAPRWAPSSLRLSGLCDRQTGRQVLVTQPCPAWIALRWVCTAPRPRPCQPRRALPSSAPGNVQRSLLAFLEGLNYTFSSSRLSLLLPYPPSGPAPPVPASPSRRYPVKRLLLPLLWTSARAALIRDEGWRLSARERRTLGSFPFAKWAVIARRQPPQLESIVCFLAAKGTLEQQ